MPGWLPRNAAIPLEVERRRHMENGVADEKEGRKGERGRLLRFSAGNGERNREIFLRERDDHVHLSVK